MFQRPRFLKQQFLVYIWVASISLLATKIAKNNSYHIWLMTPRPVTFFVVTHHTVTSSYKKRWLYISYCKLALESKVQHPPMQKRMFLGPGWWQLKHLLFSPRTLGK